MDLATKMFNILILFHITYNHNTISIISMIDGIQEDKKRWQSEGLQMKECLSTAEASLMQGASAVLSLDISLTTRPKSMWTEILPPQVQSLKNVYYIF